MPSPALQFARLLPAAPVDAPPRLRAICWFHLAAAGVGGMVENFLVSFALLLAGFCLLR